MVNSTTQFKEQPKTHNSLMDTIHYGSLATFLVGCGVNYLFSYDPNQSLPIMFAKFALPMIGTVGLGITVDYEAKKHAKSLEPKNFGELQKQFTKTTAKLIGGLTLCAAAGVGTFHEIGKLNYEEAVAKKAQADKIAALPVLAPETIVKEQTIVHQTTAQEDACEGKKSGKVLYIFPLDHKEYQVSCSPSAP